MNRKKPNRVTAVWLFGLTVLYSVVRLSMIKRFKSVKNVL